MAVTNAGEAREGVKGNPLVISAHVFISWLTYCTAVGPAWTCIMWTLASWLQVPVVEHHCPHHDMQETETGRWEGATVSYHPQGYTPSDLSLDTDTWVTYTSALS